MDAPSTPAVERPRAPRKAPENLAITVRDRRFGRHSRPRRWWLAGDPVATAWHNALSATFPKGEAFFIDAVKAFREGVPPALAEEIRLFIKQEANHTREHLAFNRAALEAGYDFAGIDAHVDELLAIARARPAIVNLAATMALEHFTAMMAHDFLSYPQHFAGADRDVSAMWEWHAIEEIEHKGVAFDTFLEATKSWPGLRRWRLRCPIMLLITKRFLRHRMIDALDLLAQDGITGWRARLRLGAYLFAWPGVLRRIFPAWLNYFRPGFHPWDHDDRALIASAEARLRAT